MLCFWKMHGAGNDFIVIDDRALRFASPDVARIRALCARKTGIGSDGLLLLQPSAKADIRMRFFNPDGSEAGMCGNAARCLARLAADLNITRNRPLAIETAAGCIEATVNTDHTVAITMPPPSPMLTRGVDLADGRRLECRTIDTGVPHAVITVPDLTRVPVATLGAEIRRHAAFAPHGTNVDFVTLTGPHTLSIRTYERGVEAETAACGTGITAAALTAALAGLVAPPVAVTAAGGDTLVVDFELVGDGVGHVILTGPAAYVFQGTAETFCTAASACV